MIVRVDEFQTIKSAFDALSGIKDYLGADIQSKISDAIETVEGIEKRYEESSKKSAEHTAKRREEDPTYGLSQRQLQSRGKPRGSIKGVPRGWYKPKAEE